MSTLIAGTDDPFTPPLLDKDEPPPFEIINAQGQSKCILVCEHASNRIPQKLGSLGLEDEFLKEHFAWDIGAARITRTMSKIMDAPAILANYSRLVVDLNRALDHPTAFVMQGEGIPVHGNLNMSPADKKARVEELYEPFHSGLSGLIGTYLSKGIVPAVVAIHSFTKSFYRQQRPWEIGVLWVQDDRIPVPMMDFFREKGFTVGDNEPYDARILRGTTINHHADARGLPNALVEVRNDLCADDDDADQWAEMLAQSLEPVLADGALYRPYDGPQIRHDPSLEQEYFDRLIAKAKEGEI